MSISLWFPAVKHVRRSQHAGHPPGNRESGSQASRLDPVLAQLPLFAGVPKRHLGRIVRVATTRRFGEMTRIVQSGDDGNTFYVILDGQVSVLRNGRRVARLGVGEAFGELALLSSAPRAATVVADTDVLALCLSRQAFGKVLREEPTVSIALLRTLAERLRQSERSHAH